jgi:hypothetical protein
VTFHADELTAEAQRSAEAATAIQIHELYGTP